jgi:hypothetical protein
LSTSAGNGSARCHIEADLAAFHRFDDATAGLVQSLEIGPMVMGDRPPELGIVTDDLIESHVVDQLPSFEEIDSCCERFHKILNAFFFLARSIFWN